MVALKAVLASMIMNHISRGWLKRRGDQG